MIDNFYLELIPETVCLYNFDIQFKKRILGYILPILLNNEFFNITQYDKEFSLFIPSKYSLEIDKLEICNKMEGEFCVLKIFQDHHGINEYGVVHKLSKIFYEKNISILYINSFNNNYILIEKEYLDELKDWIEC